MPEPSCPLSAANSSGDWAQRSKRPGNGTTGQKSYSETPLIGAQTSTLRSFHLAMLALGGAGMALASFNLMWLSFALPEIRELWSLDPLQLSLPPTVAAVGGMIGSAAAG